MAVRIRLVLWILAGLLLLVFDRLFGIGTFDWLFGSIWVLAGAELWRQGRTERTSGQTAHNAES